MCIICVSPARTRQPSISQIRTMFRNNPHGAGYMFARDDRVQIHKGFMDVDSFLDAIRGNTSPQRTAWYITFASARRRV